MIRSKSDRSTVVRGTPAIATRQSVRDGVASRYAYIIADDHPSVALAVSQMLAGVVGISPTHFSTFTTSTALLAACAEPAEQPRIIVLDLVMPGDLKRIQLLQSLLKADAAARVLVYTADESAFLARAVIGAGAVGFVAKTSPATEFMVAVSAVAAGQRHVDQHIDLESTKTHPWSALTESERTVLLAFCRGAKAHDIVESTGRSYSTVTTHKYNGLNKLGLRDVTDLLSYIYMNGLLHELDVDPVQK
jgi:DNA-binding NarL/FixJ family response regulator